MQVQEYIVHVKCWFKNLIKNLFLLNDLIIARLFSPIKDANGILNFCQ